MDEGDTFKVTIPLNDAFSADKGDPINPSREGINEGIKTDDPINGPINDPKSALEGINEGIKTGDPINETINDPINPPRGEIKTDETINETINETIKSNPGISLIRLTELCGKSRATVSRVIAVLVKEGRIQHRGSKKTGGYYAVMSK